MPSVQKRPADEIKRLRDNVESTYATMKAKSGVAAQQAAQEVKDIPRSHGRMILSAKEVSDIAAAKEAAQKAQGTQAGHHVTDTKNTTKPSKGGSWLGGASSIGEYIQQIK